MNEARLCFSLGILKHFINNCLGISSKTHEVSGFELITSLLDSAAYNTYIETVGDKADTLYFRTKESLSEMTTYSYL